MTEQPKVKHVGTGAGAVIAVVLLFGDANGWWIATPEVLAFAPVAGSFLMGLANRYVGPKQ